MKFAIITHVPHLVKQNQYFAYAPYVREMNIWARYVEEFIIVAPILDGEQTPIMSRYQHSRIQFQAVETIDVLSLKGTIKTIFKIPQLGFQIFKAMQQADHIHLRCPGNIGLLGCFVQILFPGKPKTAKYAGNWDSKSRQPWSYRLQKWILSTTFLTRNMQVLVYGEWEGSTKNIKPFFTATYSEKDKIPLIQKEVSGTINFVYAGSLVKGKNPLYALQLVERLVQKGYAARLDLYGEGEERRVLTDYIASNGLGKVVALKGNQNQALVTQAYQQSHFVLLPSKSEGWPKALAEGMFWGCVPVATAVSCVPHMLGYGARGLLLQLDLESDCQKIERVLTDQTAYQQQSNQAADWSRMYTLDVFEEEIKRIIQNYK